MKIRKTLMKYISILLVIALATGAYYYFFVEMPSADWEPCTYDKTTGIPRCKLPPNEPQDFDEWENEGWCGVRLDNETWANLLPRQRTDYRIKKEDWKKRVKCPGDSGYSHSSWYEDEPTYSDGCNKQSSASLLGVSVTATKAQIKSAFREKSKSAHPDRNPGDPTAESRFRALSDAQDCLLGK